MGADAPGGKGRAAPGARAQIARIAAELQLGATTTRHYTEAVFLKLRVHSRAEAARRILVD